MTSGDFFFVKLLFILKVPTYTYVFLLLGHIGPENFKKFRPKSRGMK